MSPPIKLPVTKGSSSETTDEGIESRELKLNSIADSLVLLHSLRQSREFWLLSAFRKFSTKARGKQPAQTFAGPHYIKSIAKCEMEIGPHVFFDTTFFEIRYLSTTGQVAQYSPPTNVGHTSVNGSSRPAVGSLDPSVEVTPALISQVNQAAASNPILQNLLQLAAAGKASHDQLKTLGILVQSLATQSNPYANHPSEPSNPELHSSTSYKEVTPQYNFGNSTSGPLVATQQTKSLAFSGQKPNGLVIEFRENGYDRWFFPGGVVGCERSWIPGTDQFCDIHLRLIITANAKKSSNSSLPPASEDTSVENKHTIVNIKVRKAPTTLWEAILKLFQSHPQEDIQETKPSNRVFLQYQLQDSLLHTQLQNTISHYSLKQLKPTSTADVSRSRRAARQKRLNLDDGTSEGSQKSRKLSASKIACTLCDARNVPLLSGGRYCRQCLDKAHHAGITNSSTS